MYKPKRLTTFVLIIALSLTASVALAAEQGKVVNINQADAGELALLPRVGPSLSARIVEFREENGKFKAPADLMLVRGIGERTFALMEAFVTVAGETTLTEKIKVSDLEGQGETKDDSDD